MQRSKSLMGYSWITLQEPEVPTTSSETSRLQISQADYAVYFNLLEVTKPFYPIPPISSHMNLRYFQQRVSYQKFESSLNNGRWGWKEKQIVTSSEWFITGDRALNSRSSRTIEYLVREMSNRWIVWRACTRKHAKWTEFHTSSKTELYAMCSRMYPRTTTGEQQIVERTICFITNSSSRTSRRYSS